MPGVSIGRQCAVPPDRPRHWLFPTIPTWRLCGRHSQRRRPEGPLLLVRAPSPCESSPHNPRAAGHGGQVGRAAPERNRLLCPRVSLGPGPVWSPAGSGQGAEGVSVRGRRGGVGGRCSGFSFRHLLPTSCGQFPVLGGRVCSGLGPTLSGLLVTCRILASGGGDSSQVPTLCPNGHRPSVTADTCRGAQKRACRFGLDEKRVVCGASHSGFVREARPPGGVAKPLGGTVEHG